MRRSLFLLLLLFPLLTTAQVVWNQPFCSADQYGESCLVFYSGYKFKKYFRSSLSCDDQYLAIDGTYEIEDGKLRLRYNTRVHEFVNDPDDHRAIPRGCEAFDSDYHTINILVFGQFGDYPLKGVQLEAGDLRLSSNNKGHFQFNLSKTDRLEYIQLNYKSEPSLTLYRQNFFNSTFVCFFEPNTRMAEYRLEKATKEELVLSYAAPNGSRLYSRFRLSPLKRNLVPQ